MKIIIKTNIIKIYIKNTRFITIKYGISRIFIKQSIFSFAYKAVKSFLIILLKTNQSTISFNDAGESSAAYTFFIFILIKNRIKYKKSFYELLYNYLLSHKAFRNKFYCRRISTNRFIKHF